MKKIQITDASIRLADLDAAICNSGMSNKEIIDFCYNLITWTRDNPRIEGLIKKLQKEIFYD